MNVNVLHVAVCHCCLVPSPVAITVDFTTSTTCVSENAPGVSLSVTRSSGIQNFNLAALSVVEDPDQGGCIGESSTCRVSCIYVIFGNVYCTHSDY